MRLVEMTRRARQRLIGPNAPLIVPCFTALGRGDLAQPFAVKSLEMDGRHYARGRQFNLALLAVAHAQAGEPEQAGVIGVQAAEAAEGLRSARARDYLTDLASRL